MTDAGFDVRIGQALPPAEWFRVRDNLATIFKDVSDMIYSRNPTESGQMIAEKFRREARMALAAIDYVANFASEECRFVELIDNTNHRRKP